MGIAGMALLAMIGFFFMGISKLTKYIVYKMVGIETAATVYRVLEDEVEKNVRTMELELIVEYQGEKRILPYRYKESTEQNSRGLAEGTQINVIWKPKNNTFIEPVLKKDGVMYLLASLGATGVFLLCYVIVEALR